MIHDLAVAVIVAGSATAILLGIRSANIERDDLAADRRLRRELENLDHDNPGRPNP